MKNFFNKIKKALRKAFVLEGVVFQKWSFKLPKTKNAFKMPTVLGYTAPTIRVGMPQWAGIRVNGGFWKVSLIAGLLGLGATAGIFFATQQGLEQSPIFPQPAVYEAGQAYRLAEGAPVKLHVGKKIEYSSDVPVKDRHTQTLQLNISSARISDLNFEAIQLGKATGLAEGLKIVGAAQSGDTAAIYIECDEVVIDGLEAPKLSLANSEIYELVVKDTVADGLSISPTLATVMDIEVGSTRGALSIPAATNSTYDRLIIDSSAAGSVCKKLTLKDIKLFGAYSGNAVDISYLKAGKLTIQNSIVGDGTGIDVASFIVANTTKVSSSTLTNNTERPIAIK